MVSRLRLCTAMCAALVGIAPVCAMAGTLALDSTTGTLPIGANGVVVMTVNVPSGATSGTVTFSGPITEGSTTINTDGSATIGSNLASKPSATLIINGNVGVGTDTPSVADPSTDVLDVNGDVITESGHIVTKASDGALVLNAGPWSMWGGMGGSTLPGILFEADNVLGNRGIGASGYTNLMYVRSDGNVGIGTLAPYAQLTVSSPSFGAYIGLENTAAGGERWDLASYGAGVPSPLQPGSFGIQFQGSGYIPFVIEQPASSTGPSNIGINKVNPQYALDVNGTISSSGVAGALSDRRHKKDIQPLNLGLSAIEKLKPVTFLWKKPGDDGMKGEQIGFIAQDVQTVVPDAILVAHDKDKTLSLKYDEIIPILTKAVQEQQAEIEALKSEIGKLKAMK